MFLFFTYRRSLQSCCVFILLQNNANVWQTVGAFYIKTVDRDEGHFTTIPIAGHALTQLNLDKRMFQKEVRTLLTAYLGYEPSLQLDFVCFTDAINFTPKHANNGGRNYQRNLSPS